MHFAKTMDSEPTKEQRDERDRLVDELLERMADRIFEAELVRQKSAMIAIQVLYNASVIKHLDPHYTTKKLRLKPSFYIEINKMLAAAELLEQSGLEIKKK